MTPERTRGPLVLPRILIPSVFAVIVLSACDAAAGPVVDTYDVRDSAGVAIVEAGRPTRSWRLSAEPEVRIGVVDGEQPYLFERVAFAGRMGDGRIVVANRGDMEVRFFDGEGRHLATVGRVGEGPGEFLDFGNVTMGAGDTLWIRDARNPRITVLAPGGEVARVHTVLSLDNRSGLRLVGPVGSGLIATTTNASPILPPGLGPEPTYVRDTLALSVVDPATLEVVELTTLPATERVMARSRAEGRISLRLGSPAFAYDAHHAVIDESVVFGTSDRRELRVVDAAGTVRRIVRLVDHQAVPISGLLDRHLASVEEAARADADDGDDPGAEVERQREDLELLPPDHVVPFFDALMADVTGRIWIREYRYRWESDLPRVWNVYASDGRPLARIELPDNVSVTHIGAEHLTGVVSDELGVQYVVVYRIEEVEVP